MTTVEYDMDLSGGLMDDIRKLVAPPQDLDKLKKHRVQERQQRKTKLPNHDCCDSCKEGGDLLCCDRCSAAFHLQCHDPPLDEDDVPQGQWLCHKCIYRPLANCTDSMDDETASTCSSRSRQSEMQASKSRVSTPLSSVGGSTSGVSGKPTVTCISRSGLALGDGDDSFADLEFPTDDLVNGALNPLLLLSEAAKQLNPRQFELPKDILCPVTFPGSSKFAKRKSGSGTRAAKKAIFEMENGLVPLPAKLCFVCERSCRAGLLIQCDYCPLLFHLDCLNPPLTSLPSGRWMCPNHVEHALDDRLLTSVRLSERILLWDQYTGPIDPYAVQMDFLRKIHRTSPPFRLKMKCDNGKIPVKVPSSVKSMYARARRCRDVLTSPQQVMTPSHSADSSLLPSDPNRVAVPLPDAGVESLKQPDPVVRSFSDDQKQWLKAVMRLHGDITRCLSLAEEPSAAKPTASVTPQVKLDTGAYEDHQGKDSSNSVVAQPEDVPKNRLPSVSNLHSQKAQLSMDSKEIVESDSSLRTPNGLRVNCEVVHSNEVTNNNCGSNSALLLEQNPDAICDDVQSATRTRRSNSFGLRSSVDSLRSSSMSTRASMRNDELAVAHVLSGIGQLAAVAAAAIPNPTSSSTALPGRLSQIDSFHSVSESGDAKGRAAIAIIRPLSSNQDPVNMYMKTLSIGTGDDMDVRLSDFGHCNFASVKHAVIFFDELSHVYELLNYGEHGTTVDEVFYSCDVSVLVTGSSTAAGVKTSAKKTTKNSASTRPNHMGGLESVKQLIHYDRNGHDTADLRIASTVNDKFKRRKHCHCDETGRSTGSQASTGWEGSAILHHGSIIRIGCLAFSFNIAEHHAGEGM